MNRTLRILIITLAVITIVANGVASFLGVIDTTDPIGVLQSIGFTLLGVFLFVIGITNRKPASTAKP